MTVLSNPGCMPHACSVTSQWGIRWFRGGRNNTEHPPAIAKFVPIYQCTIINVIVMSHVIFTVGSLLSSTGRKVKFPV